MRSVNLRSIDSRVSVVRYRGCRWKNYAVPIMYVDAYNTNFQSNIFHTHVSCQLEICVNDCGAADEENASLHMTYVIV